MSALPLAQGNPQEIVLIGADFRVASAELRSAMALGGESTERFFRWIGAEEGVLLSTCNRVEAVFQGGDIARAADYFSAAAGVEPEVVENCLYELRGPAVARHLFRLASGLESAVLGETEIVAQLKLAVADARAHGRLKKQLDWLYRSALRAGKRARTDTDLCRGITSIAALAVQQAGPLKDRRVVVFGAGLMAERLVRELRGMQVASCHVLNRTLENAERLAAYGAIATPLGQGRALVAEADVVFTAVHGDLNDLRDLRPAGLTVVDLGVPPNTPFWIGVSGIHRLGLDRLAEISKLNAARREKAIAEVEAILDSELTNYLERAGKQ